MSKQWYIHLKERQLSLQHIAVEILAKFCTPGKLNLTKLKLIHADTLMDLHVRIEAFPNFTEFGLESTIFACNNSTNLHPLEIRTAYASLHSKLDGQKSDLYLHKKDIPLGQTRFHTVTSLTCFHVISIVAPWIHPSSSQVIQK